MRSMHASGTSIGRETRKAQKPAAHDQRARQPNRNARPGPAHRQQEEAVKPSETRKADSRETERATDRTNWVQGNAIERQYRVGGGAGAAVAAGRALTQVHLHLAQRARPARRQAQKPADHHARVKRHARRPLSELEVARSDLVRIGQRCHRQEERHAAQVLTKPNGAYQPLKQEQKLPKQPDVHLPLTHGMPDTVHVSALNQAIGTSNNQLTESTSLVVRVATKSGAATQGTVRWWAARKKTAGQKEDRRGASTNLDFAAGAGPALGARARRILHSAF